MKKELSFIILISVGHVVSIMAHVAEVIERNTYLAFSLMITAFTVMGMVILLLETEHNQINENDKHDESI